MEEIEEFAVQLRDYGCKHELKSCYIYGNKLAECVNSVNVDGVVSLLGMFPDIIGMK